MVPEIDYLNARVRGMMGRLLPEETLEAALSASDLPEWIALLKGTPYEREVAAADREDDTALLQRAVDRSVAARTSRLPRLAAGPLADGVGLLLAEWDLANLLPVVSGIWQGTKPVRILSATLAGGLLGPDQVEALSRAASLREVTDRLATWGYPHADAVRSAIGRSPTRPLAEIRLELTRRFFASLASAAARSPSAAVRGHLASRVDAVNLLSALQWRALLADRDPREFFLPGGVDFSERDFAAVLRAERLADASIRVRGPALRRALGRAMAAFEADERASVLDQALERELDRQHSRPLARGPLDLSLVLAFLLNLRREGVRLKLGLTRLALDIPAESFRTMVAHV